MMGRAALLLCRDAWECVGDVKPRGIEIHKDAPVAMLRSAKRQKFAITEQ
jgi:hypothetical protein